MQEGMSRFHKIKIILARMLAVFIANGLAVIGAGSLIGVDILSSVLLAGSLGVKTKILLPLTMDARWGLKGKKSYLYNSVSLYRQNKLGNWKDVVNELKEDIKFEN